MESLGDAIGKIDLQDFKVPEFKCSICGAPGKPVEIVHWVNPWDSQKNIINLCDFHETEVIATEKKRFSEMVETIIATRKDPAKRREFLLELGFPREVLHAAIGFKSYRPESKAQEDSLNLLDEYIASNKLQNLMLIHGKNGRGKTHIAACIALEYLVAHPEVKKNEVRYVIDADIRDQVTSEKYDIRSGMTEYDIRNKTKLLIVDEFGRRPSDWSFTWWQETLERLVKRDAVQIYISNYSLAELARIEQKRTSMDGLVEGIAAFSSRLRNGSILKMVGKDHRGE